MSLQFLFTRLERGFSFNLKKGSNKARESFILHTYIHTYNLYSRPKKAFQRIHAKG